MIERMDVINRTPRLLIVMLSNGDKIIIRGDSISWAIDLIQYVIGNEMRVVAVYDGTNMYHIDWETDDDEVGNDE